MSRPAIHTFPDDWDEPITSRGFSRSQASKGYIVRITIAGKQEHVASARTQQEAARLYDLAQWYLAPKIARKPDPNFKDDFEFITREMVERECPNIIKIFNRAPYLSRSDEGTPDDELRERRIAGPSNVMVPKGLAQYNDVVMNLRRQRSSVVNLAGSVGLAAGRIPKLAKVVNAQELFERVVKQLGEVELTMKVLEEVMETNRGYYQKLITDNESA